MSKAKAHVATPAVSINSIEAANKIVRLINSRPTTPSVVEIARVLDEHGPAVVEFPALLEWRREVAENAALWETAPNVPEYVADRFDDSITARCRDILARPVMSWEDVALLGELALYWLYPAEPNDPCGNLRHDLESKESGYDVQVTARLLNGIARLTGGRHV